MRASIVSIGSEILRGTLLDTNAQYFAQELHHIGGVVMRVTQVPDDLDSIVAAIRASCEFSDVVIMTGGLGPTEDDLTREALVDISGETPQVDQEILEEIRARFHLRGSTMPSRNEKQAWRIPSAEIIRNDNGTAPGWMVKTSGALVIALPGPPRENRPMWKDLIRTRLVREFQSLAIVSHTIKTIGIGESAVADRLNHLIELEWPEVGTYAKQDGVHITVTASHPERTHADAAVRSALDDARSALGDHVYGAGNESLAAAITQPLGAANVQMTVWEAGAAGALIGMFLADEQAQSVIADARAWQSPQTYAGDAAFDIERFVDDAARVSSVGTAAAVAIHVHPTSRQIVESTVDVALTHAGHVTSRSQQARGSAEEVRRRGVLIAAEFLWFEIRRLAGIHQVGENASPISRT